MEDKLENQVEAHESSEHMDYVEIRPSHIDRKEASQTIFDRAKKNLTELFGGKRCCVCEFRGENYLDHHHENKIESHHMFEWSYQNADNIQLVEVILRLLSPFMHGIYLMSREDILAGKPLVSLWDHSNFKCREFTSFDDARNQFFICNAHHQQSTKDETAKGYDILGLHHIPLPIWIQYLVMPSGVFPVKHGESYHSDGLDRTV